MTSKNKFIIIISVIVAVGIVGAVGFGLNKRNSINIGSSLESSNLYETSTTQAAVIEIPTTTTTTQQTVVTEQMTQPPVTTVPPTAAPTTDVVTAPPVFETTQTTVTTTAATTLSELEIRQNQLNTVCAAVNRLKNSPNFSGHKVQVVDIELTDCSVSFAVAPANAIIKKLPTGADKNYTFVNGVGIEPKTGENVTPMEAIPPTAKEFCLVPEGVASVEQATDGTNMIYTVKLIPESCTLEQPIPYYNSMAIDYLNLDDFDLGIGKINSATMTYEATTVEVTIDPSGRVIRFVETIPMKGEGTGSVGISASGTIEGYMTETWDITW